MRKIWILLLLFALVLCFSQYDLAYGQEKGHIELKCMAEMEIEVTNEKGEKEIKRIKAAKVVPGDSVIYTIFYNVIGKESVDDIVINNPVPEHMFYLEGTAKGEGTDITFSIDGGKTFDIPGNLKLKDADGKERLANASEYTDIRWTLKGSLAPGQTGEVSFRAQLE